MELAPNVKDATEAIHNLPSLADAALELLATPTGWIVLTTIFIWFVVNRKLYSIFDIAHNRERRRLDHLDSYVAKPEIADPQSIAVVRDLRDAHYFRIGTGIYAEKHLRTSLIWLHARTSHLITWQQIRRALPDIEADAKGIACVRNLTAIEKFGYWYNEAVAYLSLLAAAGISSLFLLSNVRTGAAIAFGVGGTLTAFAFAVFAFRQNFPQNSGRACRTAGERQTGCLTHGSSGLAPFGCGPSFHSWPGAAK